jgi:hypothetical protein
MINEAYFYSLFHETPKKLQIFQEQMIISFIIMSFIFISSWRYLYSYSKQNSRYEERIRRQLHSCWSVK